MANQKQSYKLGEIRSESVYALIEPTFKRLTEQVIENEGHKSVSSYVRVLLIRDLMNRGLVTMDDLAEILAGAAA